MKSINIMSEMPLCPACNIYFEELNCPECGYYLIPEKNFNKRLEV